MLLLTRLGLCLTYVGAVLATISTTGFTVTLDGISYFLPPKPVGSVQGRRGYSQGGYGSFTPITVVTTDKTSYNQPDFSATIAGFKKSDDVYQEGFASCESIHPSS